MDQLISVVGTTALLGSALVGGIFFAFSGGGMTIGAGTPGRIRTCDLRIRSPLLYPAELQAHQKGW